jgi:hypothetical protein
MVIGIIAWLHGRATVAQMEGGVVAQQVVLRGWQQLHQSPRLRNRGK